MTCMTIQRLEQNKKSQPFLCRKNHHPTGKNDKSFKTRE